MTTKNKLDKPEPPARPLSGYFKFVGEKLQEFKGQENVRDKIKEAWDDLTEAEKAVYNDEFKEKFAIYKKQKEAYEEKYGKIPSKKERKSATKQISKSEKEKGAKKKEEKKDEKKEEKPVNEDKDKPKSKGRPKKSDK